MKGEIENIKQKLNEINEIIKNLDPAIKESAFNFLVNKFFEKQENIDKGEGKEQSAKSLMADKDDNKGTSLAEFLDKIKPTKHTDKVLVFGFYLEKIKGMKSFTPADISKCYYDVRSEESNTSQMIIENIKKGFMMAAKDKEGAKQHYVLTRKGEQYVRDGLKLTEK